MQACPIGSWLAEIIKLCPSDMEGTEPFAVSGYFCDLRFWMSVPKVKVQFRIQHS